jgi:site-specific recombinase XerC
MAPAPSTPGDNDAYPQWFGRFLADRATRKPSPRTAKAYRQDFAAIATLLAGDPAAVADLQVQTITKDAVRQAFAAYADSHEPSSIRRCWSTWNTLVRLPVHERVDRIEPDAADRPAEGC